MYVFKMICKQYMKNRSLSDNESMILMSIWDIQCGNADDF